MIMSFFRRVTHAPIPVSILHTSNRYGVCEPFGLNHVTYEYRYVHVQYRVQSTYVIVQHVYIDAPKASFPPKLV